MQDPYWQAVIDALQERPELVTAGPVELKPFVPGLLSFAETHAVPQRIVCHKGMVHSLPAALLAACLGRARAVFANEVFVIFEVGETAAPHVRALEIGLARQFVTSASPQELLLRRPSRKRRPSVPRVVAALQSPTLLNIWAKTTAWRLEVAELGDHDGLAEAAQLDAPRWDGSADGVAAVLVTSPAQLDNAERAFPEAAKLWVLHRASASLLPTPLVTRVDGVIALSRRVLDMQRALHWELLSKPSWILPPAYDVEPRYHWRPRVAWMMKSRPSTRAPIDVALTRETIDLMKSMGLGLAIYGQDAEAGFLDAAGKAAIHAACSCYVSPLPPWAGFGLAQHECFAAGVPVAGLMWGDLPAELSREYSCLADTLDGMVEAVDRLCRDETYARKMSGLGLEYIATYRSRRSMDEAIDRLAAELP